KCFDPSCFPPTRENTHFSKNTFLRPQKLVFRPSEFLDFVSELKNKPRLKVLKRGLIFKTIFQKRGCATVTAVMGCLSSVGLVQFPMSKVQKSVLHYQHTK